jgi:hypothetical protein
MLSALILITEPFRGLLVVIIFVGSGFGNFSFKISIYSSLEGHTMLLFECFVH